MKEEDDKKEMTPREVASEIEKRARKYDSLKNLRMRVIHKMEELHGSIRIRYLQEAIDFARQVALPGETLDGKPNIYSALLKRDASEASPISGLHDGNALIHANCLGIAKGLEAIDQWADEFGNHDEKAALHTFVRASRNALQMALYPDMMQTGLSAITQKADIYNPADVTRAIELFHDTVADVKWGAAEGTDQLKRKFNNVRNLPENAEVRALLLAAIHKVTQASQTGRDTPG